VNRFRKLGFVDYDGRILVDKSLLNVVLHDKWPERNTGKLPPVGKPKRPSKSVG
jgi:CRP/FNR family transcriptional regulator, cyclic AMP receptor protein